MKQYVVMVAGGTGTRMRRTTAKQFLNVKGLPLMWWTLRRFKEALPEAEVTLVFTTAFLRNLRSWKPNTDRPGPTTWFPEAPSAFTRCSRG